MQKIKVLVNSPIPADAVSTWRCLGPLTAMGDKIEIRLGKNEDTWVDVIWADVCIAHRPFLPQHAQWMSLAKQLKKRIWLDIDDDLFHVMDDNPTYWNYGRPEIREWVKKCLMLADRVSVSTHELSRLYAPYAADITVIPNGYDERFMVARKKDIFTNKVYWRGSDSHQRDLLNHSQGIIDSFRQTQSTHEWGFIGYRPWFMLEHMPSAQFHPGKDFKTYYDYLGDISPDIIHVPLHDAVFNRCKSNIGWLEAIVSGAIAVTPDWEEWQVPGTIRYSSPADYGRALMDAINMSAEDKKKLREEGVKFIKEQLSLDKLNEVRFNIIKSLV